MKAKRRYSNEMLKSGYEAMGKINLGFAESGCQSAAEDLVSYEKNLVQHMIEMERDWIDN